jgi:thioredoxin 1
MAVSNVIVVNELEKLEELRGSGIAVVDFWATWCKPCRDIAPKFEELSRAYEDVKFLKCDIAYFEEDDLIEMGVMKIPAFFVYKDGKKVEEFIGNECGNALEKYLAEGSG